MGCLDLSSAMIYPNGMSMQKNDDRINGVAIWDHNGQFVCLMNLFKWILVAGCYHTNDYINSVRIEVIANGGK